MSQNSAEGAARDDATQDEAARTLRILAAVLCEGGGRKLFGDLATKLRRAADVLDGRTTLDPKSANRPAGRLLAAERRRAPSRREDERRQPPKRTAPPRRATPRPRNPGEPSIEVMAAALGWKLVPLSESDAQFRDQDIRFLWAQRQAEIATRGAEVAETR